MKHHTNSRRPLFLVAIMFQACLKSCAYVAAAGSPRPTAAFAPMALRRSQRSLVILPRPSLFMTSSSFSDATIRRIHGKNRQNELVGMAERLAVNEAELLEILNKKLRSMDRQSEQAEYIEWLLTCTSTESPIPGTSNSDLRRGVKETTKPSRKPKAEPSSSLSIKTSEDSSGQQTFATDILFSQRQDLHPLSKRAVTDIMKLSSMTEIQAKTFEAASTGRDVLARARTGTGKTLAFLLPAIERILQSGDYQSGKNIGILVVSPTRELATQIGDQAEKLLTFHKDLSVQVVYGGTNVRSDVNRLKKKLPAILVATPGRLLDHIQSTEINGRRFGKDIMSMTPVVVLDETDRLLDMGFRNEIKKILAALPKGDKRQTLLFSATIPPDLKEIMAQNMKKDYIKVDCINDGDAASHTNAQVTQSHVIVPFQDRYVSSVVEIVRLATAQQTGELPPKIVVFFPTARMVAFFAELFVKGLKIPVIELHSKKAQGYRDRMSEMFRTAKKGILFTSDVSARGVDYPNVSHVIQFGLPESREQYIHRLGRTGRGGTKGNGWLVLSPWESLFLQELKGIDIPVNEDLRDLFDNSPSAETENLLAPILDRIQHPRGEDDKILSESAKKAYQAFLGYYNGQMKRTRMQNKDEMVAIANQFSQLAGLREPPSLTAQMVGKMGLRGVAGLNIKSHKTMDDDSFPRRPNHHLPHHNGNRKISPGKSRERGPGTIHRR